MSSSSRRLKKTQFYWHTCPHQLTAQLTSNHCNHWLWQDMPACGHSLSRIRYIGATVHEFFRCALIAIVLTECRHSQYECDHDGHPGDPERLLPVALSLVGLQAHAALQQTCTETQTDAALDTAYRNRVLYKEASNPSFSFIALYIYSVWTP